MVVATHQPIFLPWPGLFFKAARSETLVLLDRVQFPRGRSWVNRNRIKGDQGEVWLTVPVCRKGRGLQRISDVEVSPQGNWRRKHLRSIEQRYAKAPYLGEYLPRLLEIYHHRQRSLVDLNLALIQFLWESLGLQSRLVLQSELEVEGAGTSLITEVCKALGGRRFLTFPAALEHLDRHVLQRQGIVPWAVQFHPPVYPQLWGEFKGSLSTLDLLFNCGPKSLSILLRA